MSYDAPYRGIKVVDLSQGIAGPYCAMLLAQYGADVIKVEPPEGDWARRLGQAYGDHTAFSVAGNLGKRSVALDLKSAGEKQRLWDLLKDADIFLEGFRPGVIDRLGFGYEAVAAVNPRILYMSISGFGQTGPLREKPAMDPILQAFSGMMMATLEKDGEPVRMGPIVVDMSTALYGFQAVSPALFARQGQDKGRFIDISLMQGAANLQVVRMMQVNLLGQQPTSASAPNGAFKCRDGYLLLVAMRDEEFQTVAEVLELPDMAADPRLQNRLDRMAHIEEINRLVAARLAEKPATHWNALLTARGIQNEQVLDYPDFLKHPQVEATGLISWLDQPGLPHPVPVPNPPGAPKLRPNGTNAKAPKTGEHTEAVLTALATGDPWRD